MSSASPYRFFAYMARCSDGSLYTGYCRDLESREKAHNDGKGAKYTRARGPVEMVYSEEFPNKSDAAKREAAIKKLSKKAKEALILV